MNPSSNGLVNLYIGNGGRDFVKSVLVLHPAAELITDKNLSNYLSKKTEVAYTSIDDLSNNAWQPEFKQLLDSSTNITYIPGVPEIGDKLTPIDHLEILLENYCVITRRTITGLPSFKHKYKETFLKLQNPRATNEKQMWVVGCSNTMGAGVRPGERYGALLSNELNLPATFLAFSGSSIDWAADQILRADIRSGDLVFWGITSNGRLSYWGREGLVHVTSSTYYTDSTLRQRVPVDYLDNFNLLARNVQSIHQVINHCQRIDAQLYMLDITKNPVLSIFLNGTDNYDLGINCYENFVDLARDNSHPGPEQHKIYAKKFLDMYYKNNE